MSQPAGTAGYAMGAWCRHKPEGAALSYVVKVLKPIIVLLFLAMTVITLAATLARMFPVLPSLYWAGEATRYLNFWMTCLGIGAALHLGLHFSLTIISDAYPLMVRRAAAVATYAGMMLLAGVMIKYGIQMITWNFGQLSAAMQVPMSYVYVGIPISGALIFVHSLIALVRVFRQGGNAEGEAQ
ncbi:MAG: TRAP transporter small permease [Roseitalea porphyridii]|uniref:TRAP transporter small permease n=1 Tax=Roseitalea porphyridii TaxID=1852022 RepID=UPI0032D8FEF2